MSGEPTSPAQPGGGYGAWGPPPPRPPTRPPKPVTWRSPRIWILLGVLALIVVAVLVGSNDQASNQAPADGLPAVEVIAPASLCWSGAFDDRTVDGCGNTTISLKPASFYSANAQKQDDSLAELTLVLRVGNRELDRTSTSAEYGLASVSGGP